MPLWTSNNPGLRLRILQSTPKMRFRVLTRFNSTMQAQNGDQVSNVGGVWTIGPAYTTLAETTSIPAGSRASTYFRVYDTDTSAYAKTNLTTILASISAGLDPTLVSIAATAPVADESLYFTGADVAATYSLTAQGRAISALASTAGLVAITGIGTAAVRTLTGTTAEITVSHGTGAAGDPTLSLPTALTFTGKIVTEGTFSGPTITGGTAAALTGLAIRSSGAAFDLSFGTSEILTADRALSFIMGDADRAISLGGNLTTAGDLITSGAYALTLTLTGATGVTLPTTGTLATLAGSEALTNKTYNGNTWTAGTGTLTLGASKVLTVSNTITFTATDGSSVAFGAGGTVSYTGNKLSVFAATTSAELAGVISDETGTGSLVFASAPSLTNPIVGTQSANDNSTKAASTAYVDAAVTASVAGVASLNLLTGALSIAVGGALSVTPSGSTVTVDTAPGVLTNSLSGDVALNNTGTYFDGPTIAQGATGTWFVTGQVTLADSSAAAAFYVKLWDGTTVINSCKVSTSAAGRRDTVTLSGVITSPADDLRISVKDVSSTSGAIEYGSTENGKDSTITAYRIN